MSKGGSPVEGEPTEADRQLIRESLGREPTGRFTVAVRDGAGRPVVIRNHPVLEDGRPMPTLYWLVDDDLRVRVGRLESAGGVRRAEAECRPEALTEAHLRYAVEREAELPPNHAGHRPTGGVGGTRRGVKCLHAHYAWFLAGGDDPVGLWVHQRLGDQIQPAGSAPAADHHGELVAAIDCGTNSTRLLIVDGTRTVQRLVRITRLGEGVDATGRFAPEAVDRVLEVLREFRAVLDQHGVTRVRMVATSAARDVVDREDFFDSVEEVVGLRPELLSGAEEGRLAFEGATADLDPADGPFLVVDIGGGSTEFVLGTEVAEVVHSCDIGCVRLTEGWIAHDPPWPEELHACLAVTEGHLDEVGRELPRLEEARTLVGLAGTVSCIAAVELGLAAYDRDQLHHFQLTKEAVEEVFRTLATEDRAERMANPGLEEGRAEVIVAGTAILVKVMRQLGFSACLVSEADLLDGLVASLVDRGTAHEPHSDSLIRKDLSHE